MGKRFFLLEQWKKKKMSFSSFFAFKQTKEHILLQVYLLKC